MRKYDKRQINRECRKRRNGINADNPSRNISQSVHSGRGEATHVGGSDKIVIESPASHDLIEITSNKQLPCLCHLR